MHNKKLKQEKEPVCRFFFYVNKCNKRDKKIKDSGKNADMREYG